MSEITKETVEEFIKEYEALCTKHNLYVSPKEDGYLGLFKVDINIDDFESVLRWWRVENEQ